MIGKPFLVSAVLSVAGLLMLTDLAPAQNRRGAVVVSGRGAVVVGSGYRGPYYGYRGPYYGSYYRGYPYVGIGIGVGAYAPLYGYGYDPYVAPVASSAYYPPLPAVQTAPPVQLPQVAAAQDGPSANSASIRVIVPDPSAVVLFDGNRTGQTGTDRLFHTPPLSSGANNSYRIRAIWRQGGQEVSSERVVSLSPGQNVVIDFTQPVSEGVPPPAGK